MQKYNLAIVGASGAVGSELLKVLAERKFPIAKLKLLATERSAGKQINYQGIDYTVEETTPEAFEDCDIAFFAGGAASKLFAHEAVARGAVVIDNSSAFRYDDDIPLLVPEVNPEDARWHKGIIANPNCSTTQMVVALKPLHDAATIKRIVVSTYQAVSGAGAEGLVELREQSAELSKVDPQEVGNVPVDNKVFAHQIAYNLIPHIDVFQDNAYTKEEMKMTWETQKMFHEPDLKISATTVRVPVYRSHSESINIELEKPLSAQEAREILRKAPGIIVIDEPSKNEYPMPIHTSDTDEVYVGRIREDISTENGLALWVVADQIRKGAATNAIQIAELLIKEDLLLKK